MKKLQLKEVLLVKGGGVKSSRMSFFRGVKVRVDEKWTWGEGGVSKSPKMRGRPLYTVTSSKLENSKGANVMRVVFFPFLLFQSKQILLLCNNR